MIKRKTFKRKVQFSTDLVLSSGAKAKLVVEVPTTTPEHEQKIKRSIQDAVSVAGTINKRVPKEAEKSDIGCECGNCWICAGGSL